MLGLGFDSGLPLKLVGVSVSDSFVNRVKAYVHLRFWISEPFEYTGLPLKIIGIV